MARSNQNPTQEHLPIAGIQDGVLIMNDASVRAIIKVEPINFELKSETEQNSIIYGYQSFLNSLDFPIQVIIQSKKLDLERYLIRIEESKKKLTNDLLRIQTENYIGYVRQLITVANIMSKRFYVVISYSNLLKSTPKTSFSSLFNKPPTGPLFEEDDFQRIRSEVFNRANIIGNGLGRLSLRVSLLETQELIELFYSIYNPEIASEERLTEVSDMDYGIIQSNIDLADPAEEPAATHDQTISATPAVSPTPIIKENPTNDSQ
jgi:type IV secretory pathway VirB4 component